MMHETRPNIASFVLRFVRDHSAERQNQPTFRGAIRHIQSDEERVFLNWQEAVEFIKTFVPLEQLAADE